MLKISCFVSLKMEMSNINPACSMSVKFEISEKYMKDSAFIWRRRTLYQERPTRIPGSPILYNRLTITVTMMSMFLVVNIF